MSRPLTWTTADAQNGARVAIGFAAFALLVVAWGFGVDLRDYAWRETEPGRFTGDINNAFVQGSRAQQVGYFDRYDDEATQGQVSQMGLDYAPGRLAVATIWAGWVQDQVKSKAEKAKVDRMWPRNFYEGARRINRQEELVRPLMWVNLVGETASMLAVFWLVWRYSANSPSPGTPGEGRGEGDSNDRTLGKAESSAARNHPHPNPLPEYRERGPDPVRPFAKRTAVATLAAVLFFYNPALISNAHCWPQWDSWLLPFFLWAVVAESHGRFFVGGLLIAIGAMFKGQILFAMPVLILWPIFRGKPIAALRWVIGFIFGMAISTAPWLVRTPGTLVKPNRFAEGTFTPGSINGYAILWLAGLIAGFGLVVTVTRRRWSWKVTVPIAVAAPALVLWPFWSLATDYLTIAVAAVVVTTLVLTFGRWRAIPYAAAAWTAAGLFTCLVAFDGNTLWYTYGFSNGTVARPELALGDTNNLPSILQSAWDWNLYDSVHDVPAGPVANDLGERLKKIDKHYAYRPNHAIAIPLKVPLVVAYGLSAVLAAVGLAMHDRRRSRHFLAAMTGMWVMLFALLPQMHQRYLLWGAALSAVTVALGPGWVVLGLFLSLVAWSQEAASMYDGRWTRAVRPEIMARLVDGLHPGVGWAVLLGGLIYLAVGLKRPDRRFPM